MTAFYEWRYIVEEETSPLVWRSVFDSPDRNTAIDYAKNSNRKTRVRQFKTTVFQEQHTQLPVIVPQQVDVKLLTTFFCPSHPKDLVKGLITTRPTCPECHKEMFIGEGVK